MAVARSASEARDRTSSPIDLVILSLAIPAGERLDTIRALQTGRPQFAIAALGTAAWLSPATLQAADAFGAQAVFVKPLLPRAILSRIGQLLRPRPYPD